MNNGFAPHAHRLVKAGYSALAMPAMKTPLFALFTRAGLLGLALFALASGARAEGSSEKAEKPVPPGALKKFDKDGDGKLNEEERAAWKAHMAAEHKAKLEKYDTDKDGVLSAHEKAAAKAEHEKAMREKKEKKEKRDQ